MTLPVAYRQAARDDLDAAHRWYERQQAGLGDQFLDAVRLTIDRIRANPAAMAVLHRGTRGWKTPRFPYVVYYRIEPARVLVVAVQHGQRHPRRWRRRQ